MVDFGRAKCQPMRTATRVLLPALLTLVAGSACGPVVSAPPLELRECEPEGTVEIHKFGNWPTVFQFTDFGRGIAIYEGEDHVEDEYFGVYDKCDGRVVPTPEMKGLVSAGSHVVGCVGNRLVQLDESGGIDTLAPSVGCGGTHLRFRRSPHYHVLNIPLFSPLAVEDPPFGRIREDLTLEWSDLKDTTSRAVSWEQAVLPDASLLWRHNGSLFRYHTSTGELESVVDGVAEGVGKSHVLSPDHRWVSVPLEVEGGRYAARINLVTGERLGGWVDHGFSINNAGMLEGEVESALQLPDYTIHADEDALEVEWREGGRVERYPLPGLVPDRTIYFHANRLFVETRAGLAMFTVDEFTVRYLSEDRGQLMWLPDRVIVVEDGGRLVEAPFEGPVKVLDDNILTPANDDQHLYTEARFFLEPPGVAYMKEDGKSFAVYYHSFAE